MYENHLFQMENYLIKLKKEEQGSRREFIIRNLNGILDMMDFDLNKKILCEGCEGKKIEKLIDKCGNEEIARFLYQSRLNAKRYNVKYIQWIPFDEFKNIEYLAKGGFGEVHKATWINGYKDEMKYYDRDVVLKRIYNNSSDDKIVDISKEVK